MKRHSAVITAALLICAALLSANTAYASLSARYESKVSAAKNTPVKVQQQAQTKSEVGATLIGSRKLSKKYTAVIEKRQKEFYTAMVNAEMGLRYIFSRYNGFGKEPSDAQFDAMKFAAELLIKDAQASAGRYARDLRFAKVAMLQMDERERTLFSKALSFIFATPAYAAGIDAEAMDRMAAAFDSIAGSTPNIDSRTIKDVVRAQQAKNEAEAAFHNTMAKVYTVGIIGASATKVTTTAAGMFVGMAAAGPITGTVALVGGVSATTVAIVELTDEIKEAADTSSKKSAGEQKTIETLNTVATVAGAVSSLTSVGELTKNVTTSSGAREAAAYVINTTIDSTQSLVSVKEMISQTPDDPNTPGFAGAEAVKEAEKSAENNNNGGNGNDGGGSGGSGGGSGGGCGC